MARIQVKGLEEYAMMLSKMQGKSEEVAEKAIYKGAEVIADAVKEGLKSLPIDEAYGLPKYGTSEIKIRGLSRKQKGDLIDSFGLSPMQNMGGYLNVKAGFDGYGSIKTKKYPQGVPNQLLARSIESGTSFREKNPVIRKAVNGNKKRAIEAMHQVIDNEFKKEFS